MFREDEEDCSCADKVTLREQLAQHMYENRKLKEELDSLRRSSFGIEEHLNSLSDDFKKKDSDLKRSEQTVASLLRMIEEKDNITDVLERRMEEVKKANRKLESSLVEVKTERDELIEQNEMLLAREKELKEKHNTIEMELSDLLCKFNLLSEKNASYGQLLDDLRLQVQVLEDEKTALQGKIFEEKYGISSPLPEGQCSPFNIGSPTVQRCLDFSKQNNHTLFDTEFNQLNLKEELLIAKIREKQLSVDNLEEKLSNSERNMEQLSRILQDRLREAICVIELLWNNAGGDFELIFPPLKSNFDKLIGAYKTWSDGQLGEKNPLTEAPDAVKEKEIIVSAQPASTRVVESISIATQTDRILLARAFEDFGPFHNVLDHKYNDVDMDLYRSCRKLSVLPEEEDDETFKRIPSLKNTIYSKPLSSAKLPETYKTHSADDILNFEKSVVKVPSSQNLISSCTDIILSGPGNDYVRDTEYFEGSPEHGGGYPTICDNELSDNNNFKSEHESVNNSTRSQLGLLDPLEALRQPHSFDSYLDPQQVNVAPLPRQISDPIQNATLDPTLTSRGSYLKRPRSTCRPLRLPCEENAIKREERVSKVRFDLSSNSNSVSDIDDANGSKGPIPASNLKNHKKIERISRFTVERVDEDEFRKSIEESNKMTNRKRPPLIHSVVYKKSVLHDITFYDPESSVSSADGFTSKKANLTGSPDSPYETATEDSPVDSFELANYEGNYLMADVYSTKRRKQSDSSNYSVESQDSMDENNILAKSIRLHTSGEYIMMKDLDRDSSNSSHLSVDMDIPYIDAEELPVIKPSPEVMRRTLAGEDDGDLEAQHSIERSDRHDSGPHDNNSGINQSDSSETFVTASSDMTPVSDLPEMFLSPPKSLGLSKSPTVLKNLSNFELYNTLSESIAAMSQSRRANIPLRTQIVEEEDESSEKPEEDREEEEEESTVVKLTSFDGSEMSDTVTYMTVKSDPSTLLLSSDCDSDTYVTIKSEKSALERKFSDLSENSSSPYNTPPDTSSASFCTPPDTYSPVMSRLAKRLSSEGDSPRSQTRSSSPFRMSNRNTEVEEDRKSDKPGDGCNSPYSSTENSTEECLTSIHGNIRTKNEENNSTPKHTSDELDTRVAVQSESDIRALQIDKINEVVSNSDVGMVVLVDGKTTLSEEEVEKKFQEISLAFRTDMMMLQQRMIIRKRLKDQAELNLVKEIDLMKTKLNNLRHLCCDSDSLERLSDLRKHLDIVLASANYLSGSSEAYGFVQNEEKMSGAVSVIIKKIDSLERIQEEMSKSPASEKADNKKIQLLSILDDDRHEERMLRRRSVAALALNGSAKRRASIASVPRNSLPSDDSNGSQYSSYSPVSSNRNGSGTVAKKTSGCQSNSPKPISPLAAEEKTHARFRKESRIAEDSYGMKFSPDYDSHISDESYELLRASDEELSTDENDMKNDMPLSVLRMSGSFGNNRTRTNSVASETVNIVDSLRKVAKWNVILVRNSRFQCPENIRQYVPFFITWYVVLLAGAIFTSGFLTGFNRCFNSQLLYSYSIISGIVTFWITVICMILKCSPMKFTLVTALVMYLYSLNYTLHEEGLGAVFKRLGVEYEIIYADGAPV